MEYIDFHTHIVPRIDDGAKDLSESLLMLKSAYSSGAKTVILTPHYVSEESISSFLKRRNTNVSLLNTAIEKDGSNFPKILKGAEVALDSPLSELDDLKKLCIDGTNVILLELPYPWNKWHVNEVYNIIGRHGLIPVMAHIERYLNNPKDIDTLEGLTTIGAKFQINVPSYLFHRQKHIIKTLIKKDMVSAIGSDCHNLTTRSPDITMALNRMTKTFGESFLSDTLKKTELLLEL